jgi:hypothetical protein
VVGTPLDGWVERLGWKAAVRLISHAGWNGLLGGPTRWQQLSTHCGPSASVVTRGQTRIFPAERGIDGLPVFHLQKFSALLFDRIPNEFRKL